MVERITAAVCIASICIGGVLAFVMIWGPQPRLLANVFSSCVVVFLASGAIFSVVSTMRRRGAGGAGGV